MSAEWLEQSGVGAGVVFDRPLVLLAIVVAILLGRPASTRDLLAELALLVGGAAAALLAPPDRWHAMAPGIVLVAGGALVATDWAVPVALRWIAMVLAGAAMGLGADLPLATPAETTGTLVALALMMAAGLAAVLAATRRWGRSMPLTLAIRIAGSWACAIGILMLALSLAKR